MTSLARRIGCAWLACLLLLAFAGCREESGRDEVAATPGSVAGEEPRTRPGVREADGDARRVLVAWLQCGECRDGEFGAVRKLGPVAFSLLEAALEHGPAPAALAVRRLELERSYRSLRVYAAEHRELTIELDAEPYVEAHLSSYVALYRLRAGQALVALGAPGASGALERALASDLRADAKRALRAELADPGGSRWRGAAVLRD